MKTQRIVHGKEISTFLDLYQLFEGIKPSSIPTVKQLREISTILWSENISDRILTIYANGCFTYSDSHTVTVQYVQNCIRPVIYRFADGLSTEVPQEDFLDQPYQLRLALEGELRLARNQHARQMKHTISYDNETCNECSEFIGYTHDYLDDMIKNEVSKARRERLFRAYGALTEKQQTVLRLYYKHQLTFQEIGDILGCSKQSAHECYARAIQKLRASCDK